MAPAPLRFSDVQVKARTVAARMLERRQGLAETAQAVIAVADRFLAHAAKAVGLTPQLQGLACTAGCSWCCHQMVGITVAERALLQEAMATLSPPHRQTIASRARDLTQRTAGMDQRQWWAARIPCPALDEMGRCSIHAGRPLPCRGFNSADADICRRALSGETVQIPILAAQHGIFGHAQLGLRQALEAAGHPSGIQLLPPALAGHGGE